MKKRVIILLMSVLTVLSACVNGGQENMSDGEHSSIERSSEQFESSVEGTVHSIEKNIPFNVSADAKVYKYDSDNLLGLSEIIVNASSEVIYVFDLRKDFVEYSKEEGFSVYGIDTMGESFLISGVTFLEDDHWQYVLLRSDAENEVDGVYLANMVSDYQYEIKKNSLPVVCEYEYDFSKNTIPVTVTISSQSYDANKKTWNKVEQREDDLRPEIYKDQGGPMKKIKRCLATILVFLFMVNSIEDVVLATKGEPF